MTAYYYNILAMRAIGSPTSLGLQGNVPGEDIINFEEKANWHVWLLFQNQGVLNSLLLVPPHLYGSRKVWRPLAKIKFFPLFVLYFSSFLLDLLTFPDHFTPPSTSPSLWVGIES